MFYSRFMLVTTEHPVTLWFVDDIPVRMLYGGQRWRVTDTPTPLRDSIWSAPLDHYPVHDGWRFQGTGEDRTSLVFDVFKFEDGWHVHKSYD